MVSNKNLIVLYFIGFLFYILSTIFIMNTVIKLANFNIFLEKNIKITDNFYKCAILQNILKEKNIFFRLNNVF